MVNPPDRKTYFQFLFFIYRKSFRQMFLLKKLILLIFETFHFASDVYFFRKYKHFNCVG